MLSHLLKCLKRSVRPPQAAERGQGLVEYGLILVLVAVVSIGILTLFGGYAQVEYRALHGTVVCGPKFSQELTDKVLIVEDLDAEPFNCIALAKTELQYTRENGVAPIPGASTVEDMGAP